MTDGAAAGRAAIEVEAAGTVGLVGGAVRCRLDSASGRIVGLWHVASEDAFVTPESGPAGLEVYDELQAFCVDGLGHAWQYSCACGFGAVKSVRDGISR